MSTSLLSKTRFQWGRQCLRRLWLEVRRPKLAPPLDEATKARFETGKRIGELARQCFPGGVLVDRQPWQHEEAVDRTAELLRDPEVSALFEAGFLHDGVQLRSDVLARGTAGWRLIEVKSSTQPKKEHYWDLAVQHHALAGCGVPVESASVMHINRDYVYDGRRHDPLELLLLTGVTPEVARLVPEVPGILARQKAIVADEREPAVTPGLQCFSPYDCPFFSHCASDRPKHWIAYLPGLKSDRFAELAAQGVEDIAQIPDDFRLTGKQRKVRDAIRIGEPRFSDTVAEEMRKLTPPMLFFDFETIGTAVPRYPGTRPYGTTPFQWSLHIAEVDGKIDHQEFLFEQDDDPRRAVADAMLDALERAGTIVAYHAPFEIGVIEQLAEDLPDLAPRLLALLDRVVDLLVVVRECYYHPDLLGSYSLKRVVPALVPDCAYDDLTIQEGTMASVIYLQMLAERDAARRDQLRRDLLEYCKRDTWATVRIWQALRRLAEAQVGARPGADVERP